MDSPERKRMGKSVVLKDKLRGTHATKKSKHTKSRLCLLFTGYIIIYKSHPKVVNAPSHPPIHKSNLSQATRFLELKPRHTSNVPLGSTQFCLSTSQ